MNTIQKVLIGTAAVQAVLVAVTWMPHGGGPVPERDLLGFPVDQIKTVSIQGRASREDKPAKPVVLTHADASGGPNTGWVLTSSEDFPAAETNMKPLLESLGKLKVREPIATKADNFAGLEVADDLHTRKVEVTANDGTVRALYIGAGAGQVSHVRVSGESEAFDVKGVSAWSLAENDNRYFERDLLKVAPSDVQAATLARPGLAPVSFVKDPAGAWTVDGYGEGRPVDQAQVTQFVGNLLQLRMLQPEGKTVKPEMGLDAGFLVTWTVLENGNPVTHEYRISPQPQGADGKRWLKIDTSPYVFTVNKGAVATAIEKPLDPLFSDGPVDVPEP